MTIREGLGYTLRNYNPCFNFNSDRFCCSDRGAAFRKNIIASEGAGNTVYTLQAQYYDANDARSLATKQSGIVDPQAYTFAPVDQSYMWCSRLPCTVNIGGVPCQKNQP